MFNPFAGILVRFSEHALEDTDERLFPESRYRSARVRKKLIKRFGGEFRKQPCIWKIKDPMFGEMIVAHPAHRAAFQDL